MHLDLPLRLESANAVRPARFRHGIRPAGPGSDSALKPRMGRILTCIGLAICASALPVHVR